MAEVGISEFTFGFAFLYEQTQSYWGNLRAVPVLPNLQQEEEKGWDAHLPLNGIDFYYQFKLSDYLSRFNAKYISDGTYTTPYYRFWLHQRNNNRQHQRLRQHCQANPNTFYVAPEFNSIEDFNDSFLTRQVASRSRIIPLNGCPDIFDNDHHCVTFQKGDQSWILHSEPRKQERSFTGDDLNALYKESRHTWQRIDLLFAERLLEKTREVARRSLMEAETGQVHEARPLIDTLPPVHDRRSLLLRSADILAATLGITLVIVGAGE